MGWFGVRSVYLCRRKADGTNVFEERVVVFEAGSFAEAMEKAERESEGYARAGGFVAHPERVAYEQDGDALIEGYEVWSEIFEARMSLEEVYGSRYGRFGYRAEG